MKKWNALFSITILSLLCLYCGGSSSSGGGSSSNGDTYPRFESGDNEISGFTFPASTNSTLGADIAGTINDTEIIVVVPHGTALTSLVAEFITNSTNITVGGIRQVNGVTPNDFSSDVIYAVTADNGEVKNYTVRVSKAPSTEKVISSFSLSGTPGTVDEAAGTIKVDLPPRTSTSGLIASFTAVCDSVLVNGVKQTTGETENNFSSAVIYTVIAEDGTSRTYTVTVNVLKSPLNDMSSFVFKKEYNSSLSSDIEGIISNNTISVVLPYGTPAENLIAGFTTNGERVLAAGTQQESDKTSNSYTSAVEYTVVAEDLSEQKYTVTVSIAKNNAKSMTSFSLDGEDASIDEGAGKISILFPETKSLAGLKAAFTATGASVTVNGTTQESGTTENDFSSAVTYRVTADDDTFRDYDVTVTKTAEIAGLWNFDYSGGTDFTSYATVRVPGISGYGLQFDGYSSYVLVPDDPSLTLAKAGTIEAMVYVLSHKTYAGIVHKGVKKDFSDETFSLQYWTTAGKLRFMVTNSAGDSSWVDSPTALELKTWYHIVATWDVAESKISIYLNGSLDCEGSITTGDVRDSAGGLVIGAQLPEQYNSSWGNLGFNGIIDRVQLLSRALTPEEVSSRYAEFQAEESGLTAFILKIAPGNRPLLFTALLVILAMVAGLYFRNRAKYNPKNM